MKINIMEHILKIMDIELGEIFEVISDNRKEWYQYQFRKDSYDDIVLSDEDGRGEFDILLLEILNGKREFRKILPYKIVYKPLDLKTLILEDGEYSIN